MPLLGCRQIWPTCLQGGRGRAEVRAGARAGERHLTRHTAMGGGASPPRRPEPWEAIIHAAKTNWHNAAGWFIPQELGGMALAPSPQPIPSGSLDPPTHPLAFAAAVRAAGSALEGRGGRQGQRLRDGAGLLQRRCVESCRWGLGSLWYHCQDCIHTKHCPGAEPAEASCSAAVGAARGPLPFLRAAAWRPRTIAGQMVVGAI